MNLSEMETKLGLKNLTTSLGGADKVAVSYGYSTDLMSEALGNVMPGGVLVTIQSHMNVVAAAVRSSSVAVIFSCGQIPAKDIIDRAAREGIYLYASESSTFDIAGKLYELGVRGRRRGWKEGESNA